MTTTNDRQQQLNKFIALKKQQATKAKQDVVSKAAKEIVKAELAAVNKKYEMSFDEEECLIVKNNKTKEVVKISHSPFMYHLSKMITKSGYKIDDNQHDFIAAMAIMHAGEKDVVKAEELAKDVFKQVTRL